MRKTRKKKKKKKGLAWEEQDVKLILGGLNSKENNTAEGNICHFSLRQ